MRTLLLSLLLLVAGMLAGAISCYLLIDWRIGASEAKANLYQVGAMQAYDLLNKCNDRNSPRWAR
jgi:hypothetical protein